MIKSTLTAALLLALTSACANLQVTESGFLSEYDDLQVAEEERARASHIDEGVDWSSYDSILAEPMEFRLQSSSPDKAKAEQEQKLREYWATFLGEKAPQMQLVETAGPSTLRVRCAVTEIQKVSMFWNYFFAIVVLWPVDFGGATLEVEILDSQSGQQLAAIVNADRATAWDAIQSMVTLGHACDALLETAEWVGTTVRDMPAVSEGQGQVAL